MYQILVVIISINNYTKSLHFKQLLEIIQDEGRLGFVVDTRCSWYFMFVLTPPSLNYTTWNTYVSK